MKKQTQFKANFRKAKMNVNSFITKDYRKKDDFAVQKNKPNSKPISADPKMNLTFYVRMVYEKYLPFQTMKKQTQFKPKTNH